MRWVHISPHQPSYGAGGPAPTFRITSDDDGFANIELAPDPRQLAAPISDPADLWTQFSSLDGATDGSVAGATVQIRSGFADWTVPLDAWQKLAQGHDRIYFRVRASTQASGTATYTSVLDREALNGNAPWVGVEQMSGTPPDVARQVSADVWAAMDLWDRMWLIFIEMLPESSPRRQAYSRVLNHALYAESGTQRCAKLLGLFVQLSEAGQVKFPTLMDLRLQIGSNETTPALTWKDERGEDTLLGHLLALFEVPFHRRITATQSELVEDVIAQLTDPGGEINQGYAGTCAATSITVYTILRNPAEVARWVRGLVDKRRLRVRLKNGDYMRVNSRCFSRATWLNLPAAARTVSNINLFMRSWTERAVQAALMDYGNFRARYNPQSDNYTSWLGTVMSSGLWEFEITRALEAIFDESWTWEFGGAGSSMSAPNRAAIATSLWNHLGQGALPVLVCFSPWGTGAHAVVGVKLENNQLVCRNPQYRGRVPASPTGAVLANPARTVSAAHRAEESFTQASIGAAVRGYIYENPGSASERGYRASEIPSHLQATVTPTNNS